MLDQLERGLEGVLVAESELSTIDPDAVVLTSGAFGTVFYLAVVALFTGRFLVLR